MKKTEYGIINNLKSEQDWMNHFKNNKLSGRGPVAMYSCKGCDEIVDFIEPHICQSELEK